MTKCGPMLVAAAALSSCLVILSINPAVSFSLPSSSEYAFLESLHCVFQPCRNRISRNFISHEIYLKVHEIFHESSWNSSWWNFMKSLWTLMIFHKIFHETFMKILWTFDGFFSWIHEKKSWKKGSRNFIKLLMNFMKFHEKFYHFTEWFSPGKLITR
jgi:hypothetical protein